MLNSTINGAITSSGEGSDSVLSSGTGGLGSLSSAGSDLNMNSVDSELFESLADLLSGLHSSVG